MFRSGIRAVAIAGVLAVSLTAIAILPAYSADRNFSKGAELYRSGRFKAAIPCLQEACRREPTNFTARYYLANCFAKSMDGYRAQKEYRKCLNSNPDPLTESYCWMALAAYSGLSGSPPRGQTNRSQRPAADLTFWNPGSSPISINQPTPSSGAANKADDGSTPLSLPSTFDVAVRDKACKRIANQADDSVKRLGYVKERRSESLERLSERSAEVKRAQGKSIVEVMKTEKIRLGQKLVPKYSQEDYDSVIAAHEKAAQDIEKSGQKAMQMSTMHVSRRQAAIAESAASLTSQLSRTPSIADSTAIEPLNTGLYVRNYQPISKLLENLPPVTPRVAKADSMQGIKPLSAQGKSGPLRNGKDAARPPKAASKFDSSGRNTVKTEVRGELLR